GFSILWPDLRGHGENPQIKWSSLGGRDGDDLKAALNFLRSLKSENQKTLVGESFGVYGVELGAFSALKAARTEPQIKVLVLDSVSSSSDDLLRAAILKCVGVNNSLVQALSRIGMKTYLTGSYENDGTCDIASMMQDQRVLLLSGNVEVRTDLPLSGFSLPSATGEQSEAYDRIVIEFFARNLR